MVYQVTEVFSSLQGEGSRTGRPTVFVRLAGCNLACPWCDTDHRVREQLDAEQLAYVAAAGGAGWVCITGGEPLVQDIGVLVAKLHARQRLVQVETNGTLLSQHPERWSQVDLLTVSPKYRERPQDMEAAVQVVTATRILRDTEFKLVVGAVGGDGLDAAIDCVQACHMPVYLQPESQNPEAVKRCVSIVQSRGSERVRLSLQTQKLLGIQ